MMAIEGYEVIRELGRGGMGVVLLARDKSGQEVAVKFLLKLTKESLLQRFQREERLQKLLGGKDGFVPLLATGETKEGPYFVMPYVPGGTLRDRLQRGMLEVDQAILLVHSLASALGKAHENGIVHRDIKPENILFDAHGKPLVADLGLAKHFRRDLPGGSNSINVTRTGQALGTTGYMAIEQMRDASQAGPPADVFALGAILYECLTGRCPPYLGRQPLVALRPEIPAWVSEVAERALARKPEDRYRDGGTLAHALSRAETRKGFGSIDLQGGGPPSDAQRAETRTRATFVDEAPDGVASESGAASSEGARGTFGAFASSADAAVRPSADPQAAKTQVETRVDDAPGAEPGLDRPLPLPASASTRPPLGTWLPVLLAVLAACAAAIAGAHWLR
jgi:serine/threonine-protein kinase